ncbi:hypothetical protein J6590_035272 [Homalodisca vitripennis]|nr:hypothetical protein J6590_035272 [Homalodisca vitripennis]
MSRHLGLTSLSRIYDGVSGYPIPAGLAEEGQAAPAVANFGRVTDGSRPWADLCRPRFTGRLFHKPQADREGYLASVNQLFDSARPPQGGQPAPPTPLDGCAGPRFVSR